MVHRTTPAVRPGLLAYTIVAVGALVMLVYTVASVIP
jgi:hypothetical protein